MQRNEKHDTASGLGSRVSFFITFTAAAAAAALADFDFKRFAPGKSPEFHNQGFSGKSLAAAPAIRRQPVLRRRRNRPAPSVAAGTVMAASAVMPMDGLSVSQASAIAAAAAVASSRPIGSPASLQGRSAAAAAAAAAARAEKVQAFHTTGAAAAAAAACRACNDGKADRGGPGPLDTSRFGYP